MYLLGLTGSIGMGKSTVIAMARRLKIPVYDADKGVHWLYAYDRNVIEAVAAQFPDVMVDGKVNRMKLSALAAADPAIVPILQKILYPRLALYEKRMLLTARRHKAKLVILDIPLLYETQAELRLDSAMVVTAPRFIQLARVMKRPGMSLQKFDKINRLQMPDLKKRARADFVLHTGLGKAYTYQALRRALAMIDLSSGSKWRSFAYARDRARYGNDRI